ncbi:hypothetical protein [Glutamicibacter sp. AOP5-A2-18]|uniref:hypothetical protein n=1 Tax=Glutamicibacter sp. AOP5-A2-18 TaxID=3457656 RepID=UPI0040334826
MARDRANINTNIWTDDHWRTLTRDQQWLYELILTHPELSYAGVADWRPGRLAQFSAGTSRRDIERLGAELQSERFIFIDEDTEEVLIRSFSRHDGLLKQPKLTVSMVNAYGAIASNEIRQIFIYELRRLHREYPEMKAFENQKVLDLMKLPARNMDEFTQGFTPELTLDVTPAVTPTFTPNADQELALPTSTATSTDIPNGISGVNSLREKTEPDPNGEVGKRLPPNFTVDAQMHAWALEHAPNINTQASTQKFKAHYRSVAGPNQFKTDWTAAWQAWLLGDQQRHNQTSSRTGHRQTDRMLNGYEAMSGYNPNPQNPFQGRELEQ